MLPVGLRYASLFVLTLGAAAQKATTPSPMGLPPVQPNSPMTAGSFKITDPPRLQVFVANAVTPCFTLRTYGFTKRDLQSDPPRASAYATCIPANPNGLRQLNVPAKVMPAR